MIVNIALSDKLHTQNSSALGNTELGDTAGCQRANLCKRCFQTMKNELNVEIKVSLNWTFFLNCF